MKKTLTLVWEGIIIALLTSCYTYRDVNDQAAYDKYKIKKSIYVLKVQTPDDSLYFSEKMPGKLTDKDVTGIHQVLLQEFNADSLIYKQAKYKPIIDHVYKGGVKYEVYDVDGLRFVFDATDTLHIPYSDITGLRIKIFQPGNVALIIGGGVTGLVGLGMWIVSNMTFENALGF